jgi:hypothetical protein
MESWMRLLIDKHAWEQGQSAPVEQLIPDEWISPLDRAKVRLPVRFEICAECKCPTFLDAVGVTEHGVWTRSELLESDKRSSVSTRERARVREEIGCFGKASKTCKLTIHLSQRRLAVSIALYRLTSLARHGSLLVVDRQRWIVTHFYDHTNTDTKSERDG